MTRKEALASGAKRYTGKACAKHPDLQGERYTTDGQCYQCAKNKRKEGTGLRTLAISKGLKTYKGVTCATHPGLEGLRCSTDASCVECALQTSRQWKKDNKEAHHAYNAKWRKTDKGIVVGRRKDAAYASRNPDKVTAKCSRRRATKLQATPDWGIAFFIEEAYALAKLREQVVGGKWHVDHIVPLKSKLVCGLHVEHNLRVIPAQHNISKGNKYWPDMPA